MADLPVTRCRGGNCRAPICWVPTPGGKAMPIDAEPVPGGNVVIERDLLGGPYASVLNIAGIQEAARRGVPTYMPHHATCPDVDEFRRG